MRGWHRHASPVVLAVHLRGDADGRVVGTADTLHPNVTGTASVVGRKSMAQNGSVRVALA